MGRSFRFSYYAFIFSSHICTLGQAHMFIPTLNESTKKICLIIKRKQNIIHIAFLCVVLVSILFHCKYEYYPGIVLFNKALLHIKAKGKA